MPSAVKVPFISVRAFHSTLPELPSLWSLMFAGRFYYLSFRVFHFNYQMTVFPRERREESRRKTPFLSVQSNATMSLLMLSTVLCVTLDVKGARVFEESDVIITRTNCR